MTKAELIKELCRGRKINSLFDFKEGYECLRFKSEKPFQSIPNNEIIYIGETQLLFKPTLDKDDIKSLINDGKCCTKQDFIDECNGHEDLAERLFEFVDWEAPELDSLLGAYDDYDFEDTFGYPIEEAYEKPMQKNEKEQPSKLAEIKALGMYSDKSADKGTPKKEQER